MVIILLASSDPLGAPQTEGWLRRILAALFGALPEENLDLIHILVRKAGHVAAYAILGWLSYRSARGPLPSPAGWSPRAATYALGFSFVTATLDELHQLLTRTRTGSVWDVALDVIGTLLALGWIRMAGKRQGKAASAR